MFLSYVGHTARLRVAEQYTSPDYIRYISQGYAFDTVSNKTNMLLTVTDDESEPCRIHILTLDTDKNTLEIYELPPRSYIIADGFSGTLKDAYKTDVYREIISRAFCLKIDGVMELDAYAVGGAANLLGAEISGERIGYEDGEKIALSEDSYTDGDKAMVLKYHHLLGSILERMTELGTAGSFTRLMNLYANRVTSDMPLEDLIEFTDELCGVKLKKMNIRLAAGAPAKFGDGVIWCLDAEEAAEQLNEYFRVKDVIFYADTLGIPKVEAGENPYKSLPEKVSEIIKDR